MKRWHLTAIVGAIALVGATVAIGATFIVTGKTISHVNVVRETAAQTTSSTTFVNLTGATTTIIVPGGENALILARFSGESACSGGGTGGNWCSVKILLDGIEMDPAAGGDFSFDSTNDGGDTANSWEARSMDRSRAVGPGTHVVVVQWMVTSATTVFRLDDWSLTVERSQL